MSKLRAIVILGLGIILGVIGVTTYSRVATTKEWSSPLESITEVKEKPYEKYSFERLASREYKSKEIEIGRTITEQENYSASIFYYESEGRRISGQITFPMSPFSNKRPVIIMARGYVDKEGYVTGTGTKNAAAYYASHGYITLAPDFSGYGESDPEIDNGLGSRLTKPLEVLDLLASLPSLPQVDTENVYLWGHSNGGQIMLSVMEIMGMGSLQSSALTVRGATLWAPVSKPFPYSILYYTDEADDKGKWLRSEIARFEKDYDVYNYSIDWYWDYLHLPILVQQGTADPEVPKIWSDELVTTLKEKDKEVTYQVYPGADHNMRPVWEVVVMRDLQWFDTL